MFKRSQYVVLGLVIVLVLVVLNLPPSTVSRLKLAMGGLFLPLFGLSSAGQLAVSKGATAIMPRRELISENARLEKENAQLRIRLAQAETSRRENERLLQLLDRQQRALWKLKFARVVARDPVNWWRTVQIDVGSRDGITNNLAVLTAEGLVGRVSATGLTRSQVVLVGSPDCQVGAQVEETREQGLITGGSGMPTDTAYVRMNSFGNSARFKPGLKVVTSGLGGVFPAGIPIGTIADVREVEFGLYKQAQVRLSARLNALEEVWVILP